MRQEFLQDAFNHAQAYASFLQQQLGRRYGLADIFPQVPSGLGGGAYALHPYYRESRRVQGLATVREQDILPVAGGRVATLPLNSRHQPSAIVIGNYANDHHYPGFRLALQPKSLRWGGRWTGTPFALPYECLIPAEIDGLLVCQWRDSLAASSFRNWSSCWHGGRSLHRAQLSASRFARPGTARGAAARPNCTDGGSAAV
jgi:hypothetical protein